MVRKMIVPILLVMMMLGCNKDQKHSNNGEMDFLPSTQPSAQLSTQLSASDTINIYDIKNEQIEEYVRHMKPGQIIEISDVKIYEDFKSHFWKFGNPPSGGFSEDNTIDMGMYFIQLYFSDSTQPEYKPTLLSYVSKDAQKKIEKLDEGFGNNIKSISTIVKPVESPSSSDIDFIVLRRTSSYAERRGMNQNYDVYKGLKTKISG